MNHTCCKILKNHQIWKTFGQNKKIYAAATIVGKYGAMKNEEYSFFDINAIFFITIPICRYLYVLFLILKYG